MGFPCGHGGCGYSCRLVGTAALGTGTDRPAPLTRTALLRLPVDADALALAGPGVRQERLAVTVFVDWTFTHVCHAGPTGTNRKE